MKLIVHVFPVTTFADGPVAFDTVLTAIALASGGGESAGKDSQTSMEDRDVRMA